MISKVTTPVLVGASFVIDGSAFTKGAMVNFFVATSKGPVNAGPLKPSSVSPTQLMVPVPASTTQGEGFVSVQVVNTDSGFAASNLGYALLQGSAAAGLPSITGINGHGLASTSIEPGFASANVETTLAQGAPVIISGSGFDITNGVAIDVFCACPGGKLAPVFLNPGNPNLKATSINFVLAAAAPTGPASIVVSNAGGAHTYTAKTAAVSAPIGARVIITKVTQAGNTITVNGAGFSILTVINLFNLQAGATINFGGLHPDGTAKIPLAIVDSSTFTLKVPAGTISGAAFVQALNPPFVPYTSSGNDPCGAFILLAPVTTPTPSRTPSRTPTGTATPSHSATRTATPRRTPTPVKPTPTPVPGTISGVVIEGPVAGAAVSAYAVNTGDGSNQILLGKSTTSAAGTFTITLNPITAGPVRLTASGGSFVSEMNGATITAHGTLSALVQSAAKTPSGISINPLSDFVNSLTLGKLKGGGITFSAAFAGAVAAIEKFYGLKTDPDFIIPSYEAAAIGTGAGNLGLVLGALINEDQHLCPASPGDLAAALSADIKDGMLDGKQSGSPVSYCSGALPAIAGITDFQDALSALTQLQNVPRAFDFGGSGNILTTKGIANRALGGSVSYPPGPLAMINRGLGYSAPPPLNSFAPPGGTPKMNQARFGPSATLLPNGQVLIAGGCVDLGGGSSKSLASTDIYDPVTNSFAGPLKTPTMNLPRSLHSAVLLNNGKVLIALGNNCGTSIQVAAGHTELYDPMTNSFAPNDRTATMNVSRLWSTMTAMPNGKVLIAGGEGFDTLTWLASTELYNTSTNTFAPPDKVAHMNTARGKATATLLPNGKVLIAGGEGDIGSLASTELYDPATNTFAPPAKTPSMNSARSDAASILLPNGKVLIIGGQNGFFGDRGPTSTELYDPVKNTFAPVADTPTLNLMRAFATATLLPNGKVLVEGGVVVSGASNTTELYDPETNKFAGPTMTASTNHDTGVSVYTLLPNGKVLGAGFFDDTCELYTP